MSTEALTLHQQLTRLPTELGSCYALEELDASDNYLTVWFLGFRVKGQPLLRSFAGFLDNLPCLARDSVIHRLMFRPSSTSLGAIPPAGGRHFMFFSKAPAMWLNKEVNKQP